MNPTEQKLRALLKAVIDECARNPEFESRLALVLDADISESANRRASARTPSGRPAQRPGGINRSGRRPAGQFDPFEVYLVGEEQLRLRLRDLDEERLKDIIAEHSMDTSRLAMKWKAKDRLIDHIVMMVGQRSRKGEAFLSPELKVKVSDAVYVNDWTAVIVGVELANNGPADTITSIQLRVGNEAFSNSVPYVGRAVPNLIRETPLRLERNDGMRGALYFGPSPAGDRPVPGVLSCELIVRRASGGTQRANVAVRVGEMRQ